MKVLVTGASGFLGGHLAQQALRDGHEVRVLVRRGNDVLHLLEQPGIDFVHGDLLDPSSLRRAVAGVDAVHHSAARVVEYGTRAQFRDANVVGTANLISAARAAGVPRFVFVSSPSALMQRGEGDRLGIDESTPYPTRYYNLYSATKAEAERHVLASNAPGFTTVSLRPRGIWGPRDYSGFLPRLLVKMAEGKLPDLFGDHRPLASMCHCANAVRACLLAAEAPAERVGGRAYFVTDREQTDVGEFLDGLAMLFGVRPPTRMVDPRLAAALAEVVELVWKLPPLAARREPPLSRYALTLFTQSTTYDITAAERDLGYRPAVDQGSGLHELRAWADSLGGVSAYLDAVRSRLGTRRR
ncbi:NAD-dependent epimerase/dehydratase family protein [Kitasatospora sp. NPDC093102]|uniref:NAD-dependent epimerase/dehydratase family protein n=1 Tax=Kitasatospora sp. NPDC093102 TaxID=3155069 RepID=UPI0034178DB8